MLFYLNNEIDYFGDSRISADVRLRHNFWRPSFYALQRNHVVCDWLADELFPAQYFSRRNADLFSAAPFFHSDVKAAFACSPQNKKKYFRACHDLCAFFGILDFPCADLRKGGSRGRRAF